MVCVGETEYKSTLKCCLIQKRRTWQLAERQAKYPSQEGNASNYQLPSQYWLICFS